MGDLIKKNYRGNEIDPQELILTLWKYKYSIIFTMILSFFGAFIYLYFQSFTYYSNITMEFRTAKKTTKSGGDILSGAINGGEVDLKTEIEILKSRFIVEKVCDKIDFTKRYFIKKKYKTKELYKNSPFEIDIISFKDKDTINFKLFPQDEKYFILKEDNSSIFQRLLDKIGLSLNIKKRAKKYRYGQLIKISQILFKINNLTKLDKNEYGFIISGDKQTIIRNIQRKLTISQRGSDSSILKISYQDNVELRAKEVLNTITTSYIKEQLEKKHKKSDKALTFINGQLKKIGKDLKKSKTILERYKKNNIINISSSATGALDKLINYESKISKIDLELNILANLRDAILKKRDISAISLGTLQTSNSSISLMLKNLQQKQIDIKTSLLEFTPKHPYVIKLQQQIDIIRNNIKKNMNGTTKNLELKRKNLSKIVNKYKTSLSALPRKEMKLANLQRDFMLYNKIYSYFLEKQTEAKIFKASIVSSAKILDKAIVVKISSTKRNMVFIASLIGGLIVGVLLSFVRELLNNKIETYKDIEKLTQIPIYGSIPFLKNKKQKIPFVESLRVIRTNLEFLEIDENKAKILTITSSISGEGKTTVVSNVGKIIARAFKKTILIDLDMRKPQLHRILGIKNDKGMSDYLKGRVNLDQILKTDTKRNLDIITAGTLFPNPSELLMNKRLNRLLKILSPRYDYILLDSPPIGLITDAALLMKKSDINIVVVRSKVSFKDFIPNIERITKTNNIKSVAFILNGVTLEKKNYGTGYGFGYGYDYEKIGFKYTQH